MMTQIEIIDEPELDGKRRALVLTEDRVGHYPEFREFFVRCFALDTAGLSRPGYVRAPSGTVYALPAALEPLNEADVDTDLWALLAWIIEGVGGEWRVEDLNAAGRLYQVTVAGAG